MGLELAQATGLIGSSVLWQGQTVTLVGVNGANAYIETSNSSSVVSLSELDLAEASARVVPTGHFNTPGVFRPQRAEVCSSEAPEADPSLNACFDPSNPDNLDEILRQSASSDPTQREEGRGALREAARQARAQGREAEFRRRVDEALDEIGEENPCDVLGAQLAYEEVQRSLPPAPNASANAGNGNASHGASGGGNGGNGGGDGAPVVRSGSSLVSDAGSPVVGAVGNGSVLGTASVETGLLADVGSFLANTVSSVAGVFSGRPSETEESSNALVSTSSSSLPVALIPFTVSVPFFMPASAVGALNAPRSADATREAAFFQAFFGSDIADRPSSDLMGLLTHPTPAFAPKVYEVRRAVAEVVRTYNARYGTAIPADRASSLPLSFRYNAERRRIEVSIDTAGAPAVADEGVSGRGYDSLRGPFRSLAGFRLGAADHLRGDEFGFGPIIAYVPVPAQYLQGVTLSGSPSSPRGDGRATDRGIERMVRRDGANDEHGGSHGDREGRGSRNGRGGHSDGHRDEREEETLYASADEDFDSVAA